MIQDATVKVVYRSLGTTEGLDEKDYNPPVGWYVASVLPAAASNGLGVIFVLRPQV